MRRVGRSGRLAQALALALALVTSAVGCGTPGGVPDDEEGIESVPASEVLGRLERIASGPATLGVEVTAGCVDLSFGPRGAARAGHVLLGEGRARLRLRSEDERPDVDRTEPASGTLDPELWIRPLGEAEPPWVAAIAGALRPLALGEDRVYAAGDGGAVLVDLFADGRRRARVVLAAEASWPGEVVLCDAAGRAAWSVVLRGPWLETKAGRFPSALAVSRYPTDADPVPQRPIVEVEVSEVIALDDEPGDAAFAPGAEMPGVDEGPP